MHKEASDIHIQDSLLGNGIGYPCGSAFLSSVVVFETLAAQPFVCGGFEPLVVVKAMADGPEIPGHIVISARVCMGQDAFDFGVLRVRHPIIGASSTTTTVEVQIGSLSGRLCPLGCALNIHLAETRVKREGNYI